MDVRRGIRSFLWRYGYDVRYQPQLRFDSAGLDVFDDARRHLRHNDILAFDVGANVGQTIASIRRYWPASTIHAFEPSAATFAILQSNTEGLKSVI